MIVLHVLQGPERGKKFELPRNEPQLIGRSSEALPITDSTVSRRHAELTPDHNHWYVRDLNSANGTFVNGQRITDRVLLQPGDQVRCGSTLMVFMQEEGNHSSSSVSVLPAESFDLTIESTTDTNAESMVLSSPDPTQAAVNHLRVIYELTALTASTIEPKDLLEKVMNLIFDEFHPDRGFILLQQLPTDRSNPIVVRYKLPPKSLDEGRIPVSRTIIQHVLEKAEGILSTNAMNDPRFRSGDSVRDYGIRSAICVPIKTSDRIFGVIHIDSSLANFTFTDQQLRLLTAIGQHTALALQAAHALSTRMQSERLAAVGQTVASLSHSIKNILQGLRGGADAVELALSRGDLKLAADGWPILTRNLDRIYALTLNMLTFSKPRPMEFELTNIASVIQEVAQLITPQCTRKRCALVQDVPDDLPPIPVDPAALHQAMMNLATNAVEAVAAKTGVVTLRASFDTASHKLNIIVGDNGPGIPLDQQDKIFEAFVSSKGQRGTGLGLAVTKKIVQEHGGAITLKSEPGNG
ncbi:MAG TPA: ATP-binding protein, partial [Phycisphaerales bacterium]|nr:ATP-binding protein [Phycisphaerales bacterium]